MDVNELICSFYISMFMVVSNHERRTLRRYVRGDGDGIAAADHAAAAVGASGGHGGRRDPSGTQYFGFDAFASSRQTQDRRAGGRHEGKPLSALPRQCGGVAGA